MAGARQLSWLDAAGVQALDTIWRHGARKAAEDLSIMAGEDFYLGEVAFDQIPLADLGMLLGSPEERIATVLLEIRGDLEGEVLLLLPESSCADLIEILLVGCDLTPAEVGDHRVEALREAGNILGSAFLNSIALLTGLEVLPTVPCVAEDMLGAILDIIQIKYAAKGDHLFVARSGLVRGQKPLDLFLMAILDQDGLQKIVAGSRERKP